MLPSNAGGDVVKAYLLSRRGAPLSVALLSAVLDRVAVSAVLRIPAVASCFSAVVAVSATMCMLEPVLPLFLSARLGLGPARIGFVFGISALVSSVLHPLFGRLADRSGGRRLTIIGLVLVACGLPWLSRAWSYPSARPAGWTSLARFGKLYRG